MTTYYPASLTRYATIQGAAQYTYRADEPAARTVSYWDGAPLNDGEVINVTSHERMEEFQVRRLGGKNVIGPARPIRVELHYLSAAAYAGGTTLWVYRHPYHTLRDNLAPGYWDSADMVRDRDCINIVDFQRNGANAVVEVGTRIKLHIF